MATAVAVLESVSEDLGAAGRTGTDGFQGSAERVRRPPAPIAHLHRLYLASGVPRRSARRGIFPDAAQACAFIAARPRRYVLVSGPGFASSDNYVGYSADGEDVRAMIARRRDEGSTFILMDYIAGVERASGLFRRRHTLPPAGLLDWR